MSEVISDVQKKHGLSHNFLEQLSNQTSHARGWMQNKSFLSFTCGKLVPSSCDINSNCHPFTISPISRFLRSVGRKKQDLAREQSSFLCALQVRNHWWSNQLTWVATLHLSWVPMQVHYGSQVGCGWIKQSPPLLHFHHLWRTSGIFGTTDLCFSISDLVVAFRAWPKKKTPQTKQPNRTCYIQYNGNTLNKTVLVPGSIPIHQASTTQGFKKFLSILLYASGMSSWTGSLTTSHLVAKADNLFSFGIKTYVFGWKHGTVEKTTWQNRNMKPNTSERYSIILNECGVNEHIPILCIKRMIAWACSIVFAKVPLILLPQNLWLRMLSRMPSSQIPRHHSIRHESSPQQTV